MKVGNIALVAGVQNSGKTTYLENSVRRARERGFRVGGVLSHGIWSNGIKTGFNLELVSAGSLHELAQSQSDSSGGLACGRYNFAPQVFEIAVAELVVSAGEGVVVVDEFGPLEMGGQGLWPGIAHLLRAHTGPMLIAVRLGLVGALQRTIQEQRS